MARCLAAATTPRLESTDGSRAVVGSDLSLRVNPIAGTALGREQIPEESGTSAFDIRWWSGPAMPIATMG